jgi:hypothetical protein
MVGEGHMHSQLALCQPAVDDKGEWSEVREIDALIGYYQCWEILLTGQTCLLGKHLSEARQASRIKRFEFEAIFMRLRGTFEQCSVSKRDGWRDPLISAQHLPKRACRDV